MSEINKISSISSNIISYKDFTYNVPTIPNNIQLILDIIDDVTEERLISLIKDKNVNDLRKICKCITNEVFLPLNLKFNDYQFSNNIVLPKRSLLIINDQQYELLRSIAQRKEDIIDKNTNIIRDDRYSIVFRISKY